MLMSVSLLAWGEKGEMRVGWSWRATLELVQIDSVLLARCPSGIVYVVLESVNSPLSPGAQVLAGFDHLISSTELALIDGFIFHFSTVTEPVFCSTVGIAVSSYTPATNSFTSSSL